MNLAEMQAALLDAHNGKELQFEYARLLVEQGYATNNNQEVVREVHKSWYPLTLTTKGKDALWPRA